MHVGGDRYCIGNGTNFLRVTLIKLDHLATYERRVSAISAAHAKVQLGNCALPRGNRDNQEFAPEALTILYVHVDSQEIGKTGQRTERTDTPTARQATADRQVDYKIYLGDNMYDQD